MLRVDLEGKDDEDDDEEYDQGEKEGPRALDGLFEHWPLHEQRDLFFSNCKYTSSVYVRCRALGDAPLVARRV